VADFDEAVRAVISGLPRGNTFSYAWVADEAGYPGRARSVGALAAGGDDLPWWRVVRRRALRRAPRVGSGAITQEGVVVGVACANVRITSRVDRTAIAGSPSVG
jgi:alkylated DNA nucleotide flippase Atl1